jgi:hypothetical protein
MKGSFSQALSLLREEAMQPLRNIDILSALEKMAAEMRFRLDRTEAESVIQEPYSPFAEAERAEDVDRVCAQVARELARRQRSRYESHHAVKMSASTAVLVLCRIRDAQRHLQQTGSIQLNSTSDMEQLFSSLLIESWHSYAEPYWLERLELHHLINAEASIEP